MRTTGDSFRFLPLLPADACTGIHVYFSDLSSDVERNNGVEILEEGGGMGGTLHRESVHKSQIGGIMEPLNQICMPWECHVFVCTADMGILLCSC